MREGCGGETMYGDVLWMRNEGEERGVGEGRVRINECRVTACGLREQGG